MKQHNMIQNSLFIQFSNHAISKEDSTYTFPLVKFAKIYLANSCSSSAKNINVRSQSCNNPHRKFACYTPARPRDATFMRSAKAAAQKMKRSTPTFQHAPCPCR